MVGNVSELLQIAFEMLIAFNIVKTEISVVVDRVVIMHHNGAWTERSEDIIFIQPHPVLLCVRFI